MNKYLFIFPLVFSFVNIARCYLPVVCVPGAGDFTFNLKQVCDHIKELHPGTKTIFLHPGGAIFSVVGIWTQIKVYERFFNRIFRKYPDGINIVSHSQGTLITRTIIQSNPDHTVKNWLSISGPMMGIYGISFFDIDFYDRINPSNLIRPELYRLVYNGIAQRTISIAGYWNDPRKQELFLKKCKFLPIINNLVDHPKKEEYKTNFLRLNKTVLIGGDGDQVIIPWQSVFGGFYDEHLNIIPLKEQPIYTEDLFGLKTIDERGDLHTEVIHNVKHLEITDDLDHTRDYYIKYLH